MIGDPGGYFSNASIVVPIVRNPARNAPIATLGGLLVAVVIYLASGTVIMGILPAKEFVKSSAPLAQAEAPLLGSLVAGVVAPGAMFKSSGTVAVSMPVTAEAARSDAVLGQIFSRPPTKAAGEASTANLILPGVTTSAVTVASTSPSLGRPFAIVADLTVVHSVAVYAAACLAPLRTC